ncbi:tetratricopeptide repeat protein [Sphaerisporangium sp. NPDC049003]|uniref:tetratricopeptide repeat protein n=1 Tax=unclassified Sphaerisporangium TaxID=2630420 RepID=UPI0032446C36
MSYDEYQRGMMFFDAKDYPEAGRILAPIVERDPGNRAAVELLGRAYFHSAQLGRAEATFRRLLELDPANGWAYEALARTLERSNRGDEARRYRKLALAMGADQVSEIDVSVYAANLV